MASPASAGPQDRTPTCHKLPFHSLAEENRVIFFLFKGSLFQNKKAPPLEFRIYDRVKQITTVGNKNTGLTIETTRARPYCVYKYAKHEEEEERIS